MTELISLSTEQFVLTNSTIILLMSSMSSTTDVSVLHDGDHVDILAKIESQRALGEYSPANSVTNSRPASIVANLEKGEPAPSTPQPITHRPTGFKVRIHQDMIDF